MALPSGVANHALKKDIGIYNVKWYGAKGDGTLSSTAIQLALDDMTSGGVLYFPEGNYLIDKPIHIKKSGIQLKGVGYKTRITTDITFFGDSVIKFDTLTNELCKGNGITDLYIDCNGVNAHGLTVVGAYDMSMWKNFEIRNVYRQNDCVRFIPNTLASTTVSQTVTFENILVMHDARGKTQADINAEAPMGNCFYFNKVQELTITNCKGFGLDVLDGTGVSFVLEDCRGVQLNNNSYCFNKIGLQVKATTRNVLGIFVNGVTIEELTSKFIETIVSASYYIESLTLNSVRVQNSQTLIDLDKVQNSTLQTGLCLVNIKNTCTNVSVISQVYTSVTNAGVRCSIIGFSNAVQRGTKFNEIDFDKVFLNGTEMIRFSQNPASNSTGILLFANTDGTTSIKQVMVGAVDSGGSGYRMLRITN